MIVQFSQVNFIEKITKLDQKAVRYSDLTGYGLFRFIKQRIIRKKFGTTEIVRFRQVFGLSGYGLDRFDCIHVYIHILAGLPITFLLASVSAPW